MKSIKHIILSLFFLLTGAQIWAQSSPTDTSKKSIYTGVYNQVKPQFPFPLLGFVNQAEGNQSNAHIGFTNLTADTFSGAQVGLVNKVGASQGGVQVGMVNLVTQQTDGVQMGMMNMVQADVKGAQIGFINTLLDTLHGTQIGYVNITKGRADGAQVGFVNAVGSNVDGAQVGFINVAAQEVKGAQIGYVNVAAKTVKGVQVGFINVADSFTSGIPVGFLSFVKHGGYYAIELSSNETFRYNIAGKVGVKPWYTIIQLSHNPEFKHQFASGFGFGSLIDLGRFVRFNPELINTHVISKWNINFTQLNPSFQFGNAKWAINVGPTLVWTHAENRNQTAEAGLLASYKPTDSFHYEKIDVKNALHLGAKAGLVITF